MEGSATSGGAVEAVFSRYSKPLGERSGAGCFGSDPEARPGSSRRTTLSHLSSVWLAGPSLGACAVSGGLADGLAAMRLKRTQVLLLSGVDVERIGAPLGFDAPLGVSWEAAQQLGRIDHDGLHIGGL